MTERASRKKTNKTKRAKRPAARPRRTRRSGPAWLELPEAELLELPLSELELRIEGSPLESRIEALRAELRRRGLRFQPHVWLSTEWFSPGGVPGFAIPFYLAHPRLARLERKQMLTVEGGGYAECMRLLRHETGHALDNAYRLRRRKRYRETFGSPSEPYLETYVPNPRSRRFVLNLDSWYAQSHPIEDFAETFAVWLDPGSGWRKRYADWPALAKLELVHEWMEEIGSMPQPVRNRRQEDPLSRVGVTLGEYYEQKKGHYRTTTDKQSHYGLDLLFSNDKRYARRDSAASFLRRHRSVLRRRVAQFTQQHPFVVERALRDMIQVCVQRGLRMVKSNAETHLDAVSLLSARTLRFTSDGRRTYSR